MRIKKITIKNCGPIKDFNEELTNLNIIYGKNEKGKSFIVEFLINCLFKKSSQWGYIRDTENARGKIIIEGLENKDVEFYLTKRKKLEDYFEHDSRGLPPAISKLLVVKGGEFEIVKNESGIDKEFIKNVLSGKKILESIKSKIPLTIQKATLKDGIFINKQGEGKNYLEVKGNLKKINNLIEKVTKEYEVGQLRAINLEIEKLQNEKDQLIKAKRFKAYKLSKEIEQLNEKLKKIPEEEISELKALIEKFTKTNEIVNSLQNELKELKKETEKLNKLEKLYEQFSNAKKFLAYSLWDKIKQKEEELDKIPEDEISILQGDILKYNEKIEELREKQSELKNLKEKTKHYNWLKHAREIYLKYLTTPTDSLKSTKILPFLSLFFLILSGILFIIGKSIYGAIFLILTAISIVWYFLKTKKNFISIKKNEELKNIKDEFKKIFNKELNNLAELEAILDEQNQDYNKINYLEKDISKIKQVINNLITTINEKFKKILGNQIEEKEWQDKILKIKEDRNRLIKEIEELKEKFNKLDVDETDFVKKDPKVEFKKSEYQNIRREVERLKELKKQEDKKDEEIQVIMNELKKLKEKITNLFIKIINEKIEYSEWDNKIKNLERKRKEIIEKIKEKQGELKGLGVSEQEFERENPEVEFSQDKIVEVEEKIKKLNEKQNELQEKFLNLKAEICSITNLDISSEWNLIIEKLFQKRDEIINNLKEIESKIIAGKIISDTIEDILKEEDEKIIKLMNSEEVKYFLTQISKNYKNLLFDDLGNILISNDYDTFKLKDLSTGAKEQVLLAIRLGFTKKIIKKDSAFFILDDAFQHSDYDRRPFIVQSLINLAKNNWQIIYLTMDDHIKNLFERYSQCLGDKYKLIEL